MRTILNFSQPSTATRTSSSYSCGLASLCLCVRRAICCAPNNNNKSAKIMRTEMNSCIHSKVHTMQLLVTYFCTCTHTIAHVFRLNPFGSQAFFCRMFLSVCPFSPKNNERPGADDRIESNAACETFISIKFRFRDHSFTFISFSLQFCGVFVRSRPLETLCESKLRSFVQSNRNLNLNVKLQHFKVRRRASGH